MVWSSPRTWVTSEVVTAAHMNQEVRDNLNAAFPDGVDKDSWTLSLEATTTNPTGTWDGYQYQVGALLFVWGYFTLSSSNGEGVFFVTLPQAVVDLTASTGIGAGHVIGSWHASDNSDSTAAGGEVLVRTTTTARFELSWFTSSGQRQVDEDTPWVWAVNDKISMEAVYPVA